MLVETPGDLHQSAVPRQQVVEVQGLLLPAGKLGRLDRVDRLAENARPRSSRWCSGRRRPRSGRANRRAQDRPGPSAAPSRLPHVECPRDRRPPTARRSRDAGARGCRSGRWQDARARRAPTGARTPLHPARRSATSTGRAGTAATQSSPTRAQNSSRVVDGRIAKKSSKRGAPVTITRSGGTS